MTKRRRTGRVDGGGGEQGLLIAAALRGKTVRVLVKENMGLGRSYALYRLVGTRPGVLEKG